MLSRQPFRTLLLIGVHLIALVPFVTTPADAQHDQRCFSETGHCIAGPIRAFWERHGGLHMFGYPITPLTIERVENQDLPVQWFERDRLEDHGALGVMAGRLGAQLLSHYRQPGGVSWELARSGPIL